MELSHLFLMFWAALIFWVLDQIWLIQIVVYPLFAKVGANNTTIAELIRYNWPRTLSISTQLVITFLMLCYVFGDI